MPGKNIAVIVGGSDLCFGLRGISAGAKTIKQNIEPYFDEVIALNYNYFLDFGSALSHIKNHFDKKPVYNKVVLYGYSKGGDVVLQLSRLLEKSLPVDLLITIDIANGPWSSKINRHVPLNVKKNINVFQSASLPPLHSYGLPAFSEHEIIIENIDVTSKVINRRKVTHRNIEKIMAEKVIEWVKDSV